MNRLCRQACASVGPLIFIYGGLRGGMLLDDMMVADDNWGESMAERWAAIRVVSPAPVSELGDAKSSLGALVPYAVRLNPTGKPHRNQTHGKVQDWFLKWLQGGRALPLASGPY